VAEFINKKVEFTLKKEVEMGKKKITSGIGRTENITSSDISKFSSQNIEVKNITKAQMLQVLSSSDRKELLESLLEFQKELYDAQLANLDLQNALQKQQQTIQMLSTVSKNLNDTALAIIRKIG
jgi:hypothetical protein